VPYGVHPVLVVRPFVLRLLFGVPCQFTPFLNMRPPVSHLTSFDSCVMLRYLLIYDGNIICDLRLLFFRNARHVYIRDLCSGVMVGVQ